MNNDMNNQKALSQTPTDNRRCETLHRQRLAECIHDAVSREDWPAVFQLSEIAARIGSSAK